MKRASLGALGLAIVVALLAVLSSPAPANAQVLRRTAVLTAADRATWVTPSSTPYKRLASVKVTADLEDGDLYANASLAGAPPSTADLTVAVWVGTKEGNDCRPIGDPVVGTFYSAEAFASGDLPAGWQGSNCARVELWDLDANEGLDAFQGPLVDELPKLSILNATLLDKPKLKLVRGVWTTIRVEVANTGPGRATTVVVGGKGKGLRVKGADVGYALDTDDTGTATIQVKLVGKAKRAKLTLTATDGTVSTARKIKVRRTAAPKAPIAGRYRSKDGDVTFAIKKGRVVDFRVRTRTSCGGYPDFPTYTNNTYNFPKTKIPRNGIVDRRQVADLYTVTLRMKVAGRKVTKGRFSYGGPARCRAIETFTAKRYRG